MDDKFKGLIKEALDEAWVKFEPTIPRVRHKEVYYNLNELNVTPLNLNAFIIENDIPVEDANFDVIRSDDDVWYPIIYYYVEIDMTEGEMWMYCRDSFWKHANMNVYDVLAKSGYCKIGFGGHTLGRYGLGDIYDLYIKGDFDRLAKYYSLNYVK